MPLINCPQCNASISDRAAACVKCGCTIQTRVVSVDMPPIAQPNTATPTEPTNSNGGKLSLLKKLPNKPVIIAVVGVVIVTIIVLFVMPATSGGITAHSVLKDDKIGLEMVLVRGGTFSMGCTGKPGICDDDEVPVRNVTVGDFYIGKYEVTQKQWNLVMGANRSDFKGDSLPVENVSWEDAHEFIDKLNRMTNRMYRLPTEAEWEYAARGGTNGKDHLFSGHNTINDAAWYEGNSGGKTQPIGSKAPNELGIYDMSGNVWEWVNDWYGKYGSSAENGPRGPCSGNRRVFRGGSWFVEEQKCRIATRSRGMPKFRGSSLGLRLALSADGPGGFAEAPASQGAVLDVKSVTVDKTYKCNYERGRRHTIDGKYPQISGLSDFWFQECVNADIKKVLDDMECDGWLGCAINFKVLQNDGKIFALQLVWYNEGNCDVDAHGGNISISDNKMITIDVPNNRITAPRFSTMGHAIYPSSAITMSLSAINKAITAFYNDMDCPVNPAYGLLKDTNATFVIADGNIAIEHGNHEACYGYMRNAVFVIPLYKWNGIVP